MEVFGKKKDKEEILLEPLWFPRRVQVMWRDSAGEDGIEVRSLCGRYVLVLMDLPNIGQKCVANGFTSNIGQKLIRF